MTSCSKVEEETHEEGGSKKNRPRETNKTVVALEAMPMRLNWGHIFILPKDMPAYDRHFVAFRNLC